MTTQKGRDGPHPVSSGQLVDVPLDGVRSDRADLGLAEARQQVLPQNVRVARLGAGLKVGPGAAVLPGPSAKVRLPCLALDAAGERGVEVFDAMIKAHA